MKMDTRFPKASAIMLILGLLLSACSASKEARVERLEKEIQLLEADIGIIESANVGKNRRPGLDAALAAKARPLIAKKRELQEELAALRKSLADEWADRAYVISAQEEEEQKRRDKFRTEAETLFPQIEKSMLGESLETRFRSNRESDRFPLYWITTNSHSQYVKLSFNGRPITLTWGRNLSDLSGDGGDSWSFEPLDNHYSLLISGPFIRGQLSPSISSRVTFTGALLNSKVFMLLFSTNELAGLTVLKGNSDVLPIKEVFGYHPFSERMTFVPLSASLPKELFDPSPIGTWQFIRYNQRAEVNVYDKSRSSWDRESVDCTVTNELVFSKAGWFRLSSANGVNRPTNRPGKWRLDDEGRILLIFDGSDASKHWDGNFRAHGFWDLHDGLLRASKVTPNIIRLASDAYQYVVAAPEL